ncbi:MFS transporter [Lichenihabitans sp. Uapishka_5]|uniref:MFS transporter n=1 Tax=Lichenihabitans sp. Uapishka_5 TaxID=3037302 RepID=UPI0029E7E2E0|nr:MFS transporter [Lichenihabitans sp. Uapishka_5]MDX7952800.1 MFS transporter [Lichenihabitans sp. Uapishka_5]
MELVTEAPHDRPDTVAKITRRLLPFVGIIYLIAYIDRQNVSFAKLQMVGDLGLTEYTYGLGASLFFIGYFFFEVPSNVILEKVGARRWFARIMVSWGIVTIALAFTQNATMFYILRFLLGACEAGFFPGVLYLLTQWFPFRYRARMVGSFMFYSAIANAIGAPIGGTLLTLDGVLGMRGWEWVFLVTGIPAVIAGIVTLFYLPDRPDDADFITAAEKTWLKATLAYEDRANGKTVHANPFAALLDKRVLVLALWYVSLPLGAYGISYWLPTLVKGFGATNFENGLINIIPWVLVALALWGLPKFARDGGSVTPFIAGPALLGALCLVLSVALPGNAVKFACICVAAAGIFAAQPFFWTVPTTFLTGASAAAGLAAINSVGNLGGFIAQNVVPLIRDRTGSNEAPMLFVAACVFAGGVATFVILAALARRRDALQSATTMSEVR